MTKKKPSIRNSDWTIVERDTVKGKKRQNALRTERNQSYTEKEEIIDDLIEDRDPRTACSAVQLVLLCPRCSNIPVRSTNR